MTLIDPFKPEIDLHQRTFASCFAEWSHPCEDPPPGVLSAPPHEELTPSISQMTGARWSYWPRQPIMIVPRHSKSVKIRVDTNAYENFLIYTTVQCSLILCWFAGCKGLEWGASNSWTKYGWRPIILQILGEEKKTLHISQGEAGKHFYKHSM